MVLGDRLVVDGVEAGLDFGCGLETQVLGVGLGVILLVGVNCWGRSVDGDVGCVMGEMVGGLAGVVSEDMGGMSRILGVITTFFM